MDDFLPALPERSSLSNTEWWASIGSLSPIEFTITLYMVYSKDMGYFSEKKQILALLESDQLVDDVCLPVLYGYQ